MKKLKLIENFDVGSNIILLEVQHQQQQQKGFISLISFIINVEREKYFK